MSDGAPAGQPLPGALFLSEIREQPDVFVRLAGSLDGLVDANGVDDDGCWCRLWLVPPESLNGCR